MRISFHLFTSYPSSLASLQQQVWCLSYDMAGCFAAALEGGPSCVRPCATGCRVWCWSAPLWWLQQLAASTSAGTDPSNHSCSWVPWHSDDSPPCWRADGPGPLLRSRGRRHLGGRRRALLPDGRCGKPRHTVLGTLLLPFVQPTSCSRMDPCDLSVPALLCTSNMHGRPKARLLILLRGLLGFPVQYL